MQLKTVSSIGLAFLLVVGVVGVASAQDVEVAATQGIFIRVKAPEANDWVEIGDTIKVEILCYYDILDEGFQVSVVDSSLADADVGTTARAENNKIFYNYAYAGVDTDQIEKGDGGPKPEGSGSGVDTFKVKIGVEALANWESASEHALKVVVDPGGTPNPDPLNNLMENRKIADAVSGLGSTRVGDGVLFGVDGSRPVHGVGDDAIFRNIKLDLDKEKLSAVVYNDTTGAPNNPLLVQAIQIKLDDEIRATLALRTSRILQNRANRIEVGLVPVDSIAANLPDGVDLIGADQAQREAANAIAFKDDALLKFVLSGDRLLNPNPSVSMKPEEGRFGDNQRLELFAYVVDAAGNVGGSVASPQAADWRDIHGTDDVFAADPATNPIVAAGEGERTVIDIIGDTTLPTITVLYPNPDSIAAGSHKPLITAAIMQTLIDYKKLPGEASGVQSDRPLNPLEFKLSESPSKIEIKHADSTLTLKPTPSDASVPDELDVDPVGNDLKATVDFLNSPSPVWFTDTDGVVKGIAKGKYEAKGGNVRGHRDHRLGQRGQQGQV